MVKNHVFASGYDTLCRICNRRRVKEWRQLNPEKRKAQQKKESDPHKLYNKRKHLKYAYGITVEEYDSIYERQKGCCAICGIHQSETNRKFHLDHCHETDKVRGLLCPDCNHLLGRAKDTRAILLNAISYLDQTETGY